MIPFIHSKEKKHQPDPPPPLQFLARLIHRGIGGTNGLIVLDSWSDVGSIWKSGFTPRK